jgi:hypothetical protein
MTEFKGALIDLLVSSRGHQLGLFDGFMQEDDRLFVDCGICRSGCSQLSQG